MESIKKSLWNEYLKRKDTGRLKEEGKQWNSRIEHRRDKSVDIYKNQGLYEIRSTTCKGRGVFAKENIKEGSTLIQESPYSFTQGTTLLENEELVYKWILRDITEYSKLTNLASSKDEFEDDFSLASSLESHLEHQKHKNQSNIEKTIELFFIAKKYILDSRDLKYEILDCLWNIFVKLNQIPTNTFAIHSLVTSDEQNSVSAIERTKQGIAIFPLCSMINHDCNPNSIVSFEGNQIIIRATKNIQQNEEITISYGCTAAKMQKIHRQSLLFQSYYFHCKCSSCEEENDNLSKYTCLQSNCNGILVNDKRMICNICYKEYNINDIQLKEKQSQQLILLGDNLIQLKRFPEAIQAFQKCLAIQKEIYPKESYENGRLYDRIAEVFAIVGDFKKASEYCKLSVDIVLKQFGKNSIESANELVKLTELYFNAR